MREQYLCLGRRCAQAQEQVKDLLAAVRVSQQAIHMRLA